MAQAPNWLARTITNRTARRRTKSPLLKFQVLESRVNPAKMVGLSGNDLVFFDSATPDNVVRSLVLTGLAAGETLLGIDVRPNTRELIVLGSSNRLYAVNTANGATTAIGASGAFTLNGTTFGIDFDPVGGGLRVVSDNDDNLLLNASDGTVLATDTALNFGMGDPNFGTNPNIAAVAYTNNFSGATTTTLYGIDTNINSLVIQDPPGSGTLSTVGGLQIDITDVAAFDVAPGSTTGFATLSVNGTSSALYAINLASGAATLVAAIDDVPGLIRGVTFVPPSFSATVAALEAVFTGSDADDQITLSTTGGFLSHNLFTLGVPGFNSNTDMDSTLPGDQTLAANAGATVTISGGAGNDSIDIGNLASAASVLGSKIVVDGGIGADELKVESGNEAVSRAVTITSTQMKLTATTSVDYTAAEFLRVVTGTGSDTVTVSSTAAGVNTTIADSGGSGSVRVGGGLLANLAGPLTINAGFGNQKLTLDDSASASSQTTVFQNSPGQIGVVGGTTVKYTSFGTLEILGGAGRDLFQITPDVVAAISVVGGAPTGKLPGDELTLNRNGTVNAKVSSTNSPNGLSGTWTFGNRAPVTFAGIERLTPRSLVAVGAGAGGGPHVRLLDGETGQEQFGFFAFDPNFRGGVRVAVGDVNNDGTPDLIAAAGATGGPHVKIFDGSTGQILRQFYAYDAGFTGGVFVACGDVDGDSFADVVVAPGSGGGPHVKVYSGKSGSVLREFFAYDVNFRSGVNVAVGDVNNDGRGDIITGAGAGGGPHVRVFSGLNGSVLREFFAYAASFVGGVTVAAADVDNDGRADIITGAGAGGGPHVVVRSGLNGSILRSFFAFDANFTGGVQVGAGDINADGTVDILVGSGPGNLSSRVRAFNGLNSSPIGEEILPYGGFTGGLFVDGF